MGNPSTLLDRGMRRGGVASLSFPGARPSLKPLFYEVKTNNASSVSFLYYSQVTGVVDLLKRHAGIVWHWRRFAGLLRGEDATRSGNPLGLWGQRRPTSDSGNSPAVSTINGGERASDEGGPLQQYRR